MDVLIALGAAGLLIRLGLGLYATGTVRAKNAAGAVLRSICDLCLAVLAFWLIGGAIMLQRHNAYFSVSRGLIAFNSGGTAGLFFLMTVVLAGTGAAGCALSERSRFWPVCAMPVLLAGLIIPMGANWSWSGWLWRLGFVDVGGGAWLHVSAAACALAGVLAVGPRTGKYHRDGSASMIPGHNVPLAGVGVLAILAGWAPYLAGCILMNGGISLAGSAAASTLLAAAAAGLAAILLGQFRYGKPDVILTLLGVLGGLVAIAAGAGRIGAPWAVLIGAGAGILVPMSAIGLDLLGRIDDPAGVIAIQGAGGIWGTLAAGFLMHGTAIHRLHQTGIQALGLLCIGLLSLVLPAGIFAILKIAFGLRASEADEYDGLDLAGHDIGAYPDFQQTMIKSYHLREA